MTFLELAKKVIEEENRPLSVEEIWLLAQEKGYDKSVGSKGKTPAATIGAQIYVNMRDKPDSPFLKTDTRPQRFYLKHLSSIPALASNLVVDAPGKVLQLQKRGRLLRARFASAVSLLRTVLLESLYTNHFA